MNKILIITTLFLAASLSLPGSAQEAMSVEWNFEGDPTEGVWTANSDIKGFQRVGGLIVGSASDEKPELTSPVFSFKPMFYDLVEITMQSEKGGEGKLYWAASTDEPDGGFRPEKVARFHVRPGEHQPIHIYPFWHKDEQIVGLRIAPPPGNFRIGLVRVRHQREPITPPLSIHDWRFPQAAAEWNVVQGGSLLLSIHEGRIRTNPLMVLGSPSVRISSAANNYITLRMKVSAGKTGAVGWVTSEQNGMKFMPFDLKADGEMHTYAINVSESKDWSDQIRLIVLKPSDALEAEVELSSITVAPKPVDPTAGTGHHHH